MLRIRGFSLVELSIVLVILGLLVGGVLSGRSLIRAAELRSFVSEYQQYQTAIQTFRGKYFGLPGDITNATAFWGIAASGNCVNRSGTGVATPGTCDGDGDGIISHIGGSYQSAEAFQGWRQLALAGLIPGTYSGISGGQIHPEFIPYGSGQAVDYTIGDNCPMSRIGGSNVGSGTVGWSLSYFDNTSGWDVYAYSHNYLNWMTVGGDDGIFLDNGFLLASEAWNIDRKLDDGVASAGSIQSLVACADATGQYILNDDTIICPLLFKVNP